METEKTRALVIRAVDFSETSKILTFYTEKLGKLAALAKGGRRLKSSFEVALDLLSVCAISVLRKPANELDLLTEAVLEERFPGLRRDLDALYGAYYVAELLDGLTQRGQPNESLFEAVLEALRALDTGRDRFQTLGRFQLRLQGELGYAPNLDNCAGCGGAVTLGPRTHYGVAAGGLLCRACARFQAEEVTVQGGTIQVLRALMREDSLVRERLVINARAREEAWRLVTASLWSLLGKRPRTAELVRL